MKMAAFVIALSLPIAASAAQSLRLDATGAFFTDLPAGDNQAVVATTTAGVITEDSFTNYAGGRKSARVLENLAFDYLLGQECAARGLGRTAPTLARSLAMRRRLESGEGPGSNPIGGSLARYATDALRDLRTRELVGASRAIDDEALAARFHHRYGVDGVRVRVRHILCTEDMSAPQTARQRAQALHQRILAGESFDALLHESHDRVARRMLRNPKRKSDAGMLAGYNYHRYGDDFAAAVRGLEVDEISGPVASPVGVHLIQVVGRTVTELSDVGASLRLELGGGKARSSEVLALRRRLLAKYEFTPTIQLTKPVRRSVATNAAPSAIASPTAWPHYRGNPSLHGSSPALIGTQPKVAWTFTTKAEILSSPVIQDGTVFVGSTDNSVYAIDLKTGAQRWSYPTKDMVEAPPLVLNGKIFIGSSDFFFYALDAKSGELLWKFECQDKVLGGANWFVGKDGKKRIVFGSYDAHVYCFDEDGRKLWDYETDNFVNGSPAIHNGEVIFGGCDAGLHLVDGESGARITKIDLGSGCQVAGSVALLDDKAYFGHYGNEFLRVDLDSGEVDWRYPSKREGFCSSPALNDTYAVFGGRDKNLHCVLRKDGTPQWKFKTRRKVDASAVITGDKVLFGSGDGRLYMLSLATGKEVWSYDIGKPVYSSPAVVNGMIVVGASDHRVYAFHAPADKQKGN
jgi:eukaryotic-like serine/threonine-protein kinase